MTVYRKRGAAVDAFCWTGDEFQVEDPSWACDLVALGKLRFAHSGTEAVMLLVNPPSGRGAPLVCTRGDWLVRNAKGEVFPMTPEKFAKMYEKMYEISTIIGVPHHV